MGIGARADETWRASTGSRMRTGGSLQPAPGHRGAT